MPLLVSLNFLLIVPFDHTRANLHEIIDCYLDEQLRSLRVRLLAEMDVLLQLIVVNADSIVSLARVSKIEKGSVGHGQVIHSALVFGGFARILLTSWLPQNPHSCLLIAQRHS